MKYYLAGPMTGIKDYNFPEFDRVARKLRAQGNLVLSPHEINHGEDEQTRGSLPYWEYIKAGLKALLECDAIVLLDGWRSSRGARLELDIADETGMRVFLFHNESLIEVK